MRVLFGFESDRRSYVFSWLWSIVVLSVCSSGGLLLTLILKVSIPITEGLDVLAIDGWCHRTTWNNEGLPSDRMSTENAAILMHCEAGPWWSTPSSKGLSGSRTNIGLTWKSHTWARKGMWNLKGWFSVELLEMGFIFYIRILAFLRPLCHFRMWPLIYFSLFICLLT